MEIDTGTSTTFVDKKKTLHNLFQQGGVLQMSLLNTAVHTYTKEVIPVAGELNVEYIFKGYLLAVVIMGEGTCLMDCKWLQHIRLN